MLTVISPAKRLNEKTHPLPDGFSLSTPDFLSDTTKLVTIARQLTAEQLCNLMDISQKLGSLNSDRFRDFDPKGSGHPAIHLYDGDTYAGLDARKMEPDALRWANGHLRILSGLYGLLRPLDGILPHRLEMGSRLNNPKGADLYAFWGAKIAKGLNAQAEAVGAKVLINCASAEYFGAVDLKELKLKVVTPIFLEEKAGELKIVSFWAKKARGAMARFICDNHLTNTADLCGFATGGYVFQPSQSDESRLIFTRAAIDGAAT